MIEPVLRRAPQQRGPAQSTANFLRTATAEANLPDNKRARLEPPPAAINRPNNHHANNTAQQELYMQQVRDALREGSPDVRGSVPQPAQKRPISNLGPRRRVPSPAQLAQQGLSER